MERGTRRLDIVQLRDLCGILRTNLIDLVTRFEEQLSRKNAGPLRSTTAKTKVSLASAAQNHARPPVDCVDSPPAVGVDVV